MIEIIISVNDENDGWPLMKIDADVNVSPINYPQNTQ